jgi:hypothetical protein
MQHSLEKIFHFDSALLDVAAAGDINASAPDEDILKVSRALLFIGITGGHPLKPVLSSTLPEPEVNQSSRM